MIDVILLIELDEPINGNGFVEKLIELPFLPSSDCDLIVGEASPYTQLKIDCIVWHHDERVLECFVHPYYPGDRDGAFAEKMIALGWGFR